MNYTLARHSLQLGSFGEEEIREGVSTGRFYTSDLGWREGMSAWQPLSEILGLPPAAGAPPPPMPHSLQGQAPPEMGDNAGMRLLLPVGRSGLAIVAGYLGLFALALVPAPLALIFSILAIRDIRKSRLTGKPKYGMGRAVFGLITGIAGTVILLLLLGSAILKR